MSNLLTLFQELQHYQNELAKSEEDDIFRLLDSCEQLRQKWQTAENELVGAKRILLTYETDMAQVRVENKQLKAQLVDCRATIASVLATRNMLERERNILASQVDTVRDLLRADVNILPEGSRKKLQFLNEVPKRVLVREESESAVLDSFEYDKTDDSLDDLLGYGGGDREFGGRLKRSISLTRISPSAPGADEMDEQTPKKRSRDDIDAQRAQPGQYLVPPSYQDKGYRSPLNRSFSEPKNVNAQLPPSGAGPRSLKSMAALSPATASSTGRRHAFFSRTALKTEYCDHCDKRLAFASTVWRCEVCKMQCHAECKEFALLPCVPRGTPLVKNQKAKLVDFVPRDPPMVPSVLVHCINEIDRRGLNSLGIYRVPGIESQVTDILDKLLYGRGVPNLRQVSDVNVLAGCVKKFLFQLAEPLIPPTSLGEFLKAGELKSDGKDASLLLHKSITELPQPNRDTLAFLMIHLNRVVEYCNENKMTKDNLATCLAPTILGSVSVTDYQGAGLGVGKLVAVINALFDFAPEYWSRYLTNESGPLMSKMTPSVSPMAPGAPMLGPVGGSFTVTPKTIGYKTRSNQRKFFNPPWK